MAKKKTLLEKRLTNLIACYLNDELLQLKEKSDPTEIELKQIEALTELQKSGEISSIIKWVDDNKDLVPVQTSIFSPEIFGLISDGIIIAVADKVGWSSGELKKHIKMHYIGGEK